MIQTAYPSKGCKKKSGQENDKEPAGLCDRAPESKGRFCYKFMIERLGIGKIACAVCSVSQHLKEHEEKIFQVQSDCFIDPKRGIHLSLIIQEHWKASVKISQSMWTDRKTE